MERARILIVDDDVATRTVLARYLESKGHAVVGVSTAEDAIPRLSLDHFDLMLLDLLLPGIGGFEALSYLRRACACPIHVMSGSTDDDTRVDAGLLGAAGFLPKPVDVEALAAVVSALPGPAKS